MAAGSPRPLGATKGPPPGPFSYAGQLEDALVPFRRTQFFQRRGATNGARKTSQVTTVVSAIAMPGSEPVAVPCKQSQRLHTRINEKAGLPLGKAGLQVRSELAKQEVGLRDRVVASSVDILKKDRVIANGDQGVAPEIGDGHGCRKVVAGDTKV